MRRFVLAATLFFAAAFTSVSAAAPPFWWWTPAQASTVVKKLNPPTYDGQKLALLRIGCTGQGQQVRTGPDKAWQGGTISRRSPYTFYRVFRCATIYRKSDGSVYVDAVRGLYVRTSTKARGRVACWEWSTTGAEVAQGCVRAGNVTPPPPPAQP